MNQASKAWLRLPGWARASFVYEMTIPDAMRKKIAKRGTKLQKMRVKRIDALVALLHEADPDLKRHLARYRKMIEEIPF